jgi:hypothetical protein
VSLTETAFTEELAVRYPNGSMEERMAFTAGARPYSERSATAIGVSNRICHRHKPKIFDVIAGK